MKTVTMNAFADFGMLPEEAELCDNYDYGAARHYKIQILCATAAANAGVNSLWLNDVDYKGLVPSSTASFSANQKLEFLTAYEAYAALIRPPS